jgi:threonine/homoserine/homoserine lactone efflux protein
MSAAWILFVAFGAVGVALLLWLGWRWLMRSWEVLDDDQVSERLGPRAHHPPGLWLRMLGWFERGPRRLTYRRDKLGRFRKIWRG